MSFQYLSNASRRDVATEAALEPAWLEHRDMMSTRHLEWPLSR